MALAFASAGEADGVALAPQAFRDAAAAVLPSLVAIEAVGRGLAPARPAEPAATPAAPPPDGQAPRARQVRRPSPPAAFGRPGTGASTGLVVGSDGHVLTSTWHFADNPPLFTATLADGSRHVARVVACDHLRKLCLLKIDGAPPLPVPAFAPRAELRVGQWVVALGRGFGGDQPALSVGIVSARERFSGLAVQADAKIGPANYGGPLVDLRGRVVGLCVPLSPRSRAFVAGAEWYDSGIGFAIPIAPDGPVLAALRAGTTIQPGWLGLAPAPGAYGDGAAVASVRDGSPAAQAGFKARDVIVRAGGADCRDATDLRVILGRYAAGERVTCTVRRDGAELELTAELAPAPDAPALDLERVIPEPEAEDEAP